MMVLADDKDSKMSSDKTQQLRDNSDEPPPSYSARTEFISSGSASPAAFKTNPTNFLLLSTVDSKLSGEFVIDPSIHIQSSLLPPLPPNVSEEDRNHLSLASKHSSVDADIWLLPGVPISSNTTTSSTPKYRLRTTIALASNHGSVRAQLRTLDGAAPFMLTAHCAHGPVRLALPRTFHGLLSLDTRHGSITLSDALVQNATQLSQVGSAWRYFIGDFQAMGENAWEGDQAEVDAPHGSIRLRYVDEAEGKTGLLSRLFGN